MYIHVDLYIYEYICYTSSYMRHAALATGGRWRRRRRRLSGGGAAMHPLGLRLRDILCYVIL